MTDRNWYQTGIDEALETLDSTHCGLTFDEAERRLEEHGPNEIEEGERTGWVEILLAQLKNPLVLILIAAAIISLLAEETLDALVIGGVILLNTMIGFVQEYRAEKSLEALREQAAPEAEVVRCSVEEGERESIDVSIPAREVVPGDVVLLAAGEKVPADGRLLHVANLEVDESMLTGESFPVAKTVEELEGELSVGDRRNLVFGGTIVTQGRGRAVVFATGSETEIGQIATMIQETEDVESPLQRQVRDLSRKLGFLALGVALATVAIGLLRGIPLPEIFLFALASAVSSIPEGLPAVLTITLAVGVNRMARRNAIIRRLQAVDTLGAATVISSDKTGTLTTNQMTVQQFNLDHRQVHVTGVGFEPEGRFEAGGETLEPTEDEELLLALRIGALCNDARLIRHEEAGEERWEIRGDPTEGALVVAAAKAHQLKENLMREFPRIEEIPFSSEIKYMATFHELPGDEQVRVYVKGAPEQVLELSAQVREAGEISSLSGERETKLNEKAQQMAGRGLRVLGLAYQEISRDEVADFKGRLQSGEQTMIFTALAGMIDPPRTEVPEAVDRCKQAGIRVMMATGDHKLTAQAIAREVGILGEDGRVLTGTDVEHLSDDELDEEIEQVPVFARVSPEHKHRMVESLQRHGHVVTMTGDGVNDAPALKAAEIGVAMGITGTDVTKETAEMVLTDDNFASIVNAVEEGRVVFQNVRKVVKFLLTTNVGEDLALLAALAFLPDHPLLFTPVQILWVNLVTDGLLDVTLALEPQEGDVMNEPPREREAQIINREILHNTLFVALFMAIGTLAVFITADANRGVTHARTMAFTTMAMFQVFNALNCRSRDKSVFRLGLFSNPYLLGAMALSILLQIGSTLLPFMQRALGTEPLALAEWGIVVFVSSTVFIADEIRKRVT